MEANQTLLLRPLQAAQMIGVSRTTLYGLLARGELRSVKCGSSRLIPTSELRAWVDRQLASTPAGR